MGHRKVGGKWHVCEDVCMCLDAAEILGTQAAHGVVKREGMLVISSGQVVGAILGGSGGYIEGSELCQTCLKTLHHKIKNGVLTGFGVDERLT